MYILEDTLCLLNESSVVCASLSLALVGKTSVSYQFLAVNWTGCSLIWMIAMLSLTHLLASSVFSSILFN